MAAVVMSPSTHAPRTKSGHAGPRILVTGASSGIGRACALALSAAGYRLVLHGRDPERLRETFDACIHPDRHVRWLFDLSDPNALADALRARVSDWDGVSALVHAAGDVRPSPIRSVRPSDLRSALDLNFVAGAELVRLLASRQINGETLRSVAWVSSLFGKFGAKGHASYAAAKAAAGAFVRCAAIELAPRVRLNSLVLGPVETPMAARALADPAIAASIARTTPLGLGRPEAVADVVSFLVSDASRWMTGQEVIVDGGRSVNFSHS